MNFILERLLEGKEDMVSTLSLVCLVMALLFSIIVPVVLCIVLKKKYDASIFVFLMGCVGFFVFAGILESIVNQLVIRVLPVGKTIQANIYLYALYGGLAAGIFEETARFLIMKFVLKKKYNNSYNAIMYGAGHGGFEVTFLLGTTFLNYLIYAVAINAGQTELLIQSLTAEQQAQMQVVFSEIIEMKPYEWFAAYIERVPAVAIHIGLSVLVWIAVTGKKYWLYPLAIALHAFVDGFFLILADIIQKAGGSALWVEVAIYIMAAGLCVLAFFFGKKNG